MPRKKESPPRPRSRKAAVKQPEVNPGVNPAVEHVPPGEGPPFPIVAVGASAGGLEPTSALLAALPKKPGMAFVVIQHLSPTHESMLSEILARDSVLPVTQVTDQMTIEPDHVYVIPPGKNLVLDHGRLALAPRTEIRGQARPIDHFMRSLAEQQGPKAVGVVLSGTASDGSLGVQEIKAGGGITFAQDDTAVQSSMPRSAIATGAIDFVLPPAEIGRELGRIARHPYVRPVFDETAIDLDETGLQRVLGLLRKVTGVNFDGYKRNTLTRRVARRMVLHRIDGFSDYVRKLETEEAEVEALYHDVLINVTSFFRNADAYEALKKEVFPKLVAGRGRHEQVRAWALGCSTGEEAYSIAMAYTEFIEQSGVRVPLQVFATDLNGAGIEKARAGIYPRGIVQDVSPERLRRFFLEIDGSYRVAKPIRDMCVFARQNVLADPPFSRLDLVACRNMLIYLEPTLQQRLMPLLHYALRNDGFLWLGGSETIGSYRELFEMVDARNKIYAKKSAGHVSLGLPIVPARWSPARAPGETPPRQRPDPEPQRDAERLLLSRYTPAAVVVDTDLQIIQFRGDTSPYITPSPGRASLSLVKMLREGLMVPVRGALQRARREGKPTREAGLRVRSNGGWREVDVEIVPLRPEPGTAFLVVFEEPAANVKARARILEAEAEADLKTAARSKPTGSAKEVERLRQELAATRDYLQSVIEQQEAANEELQSANEEVQSSNEELQSINEEMETSKEEIQSANEELATVNDELQNRNLELTSSNNDLSNLIASVQLPIVMVGRDLRIRRFTPAAEKVFNLIPADIGRPFADLNLRLDGPDVRAIVNDVVESIAPQEHEVRDRNGHWYLLRVRPYLTQERQVDGAVIVMVDIGGLKSAEQSARESEGRFEVLANSAPVLIWTTDGEGLLFVNRAFELFAGELEKEIRHTRVERFVHPDDRAGFTAAFQAAERAREVFEFRARLRRADGQYRWMKTIATPRLHEESEVVGFVAGTFDVTDLQEAEAALRTLDQEKDDFLAILAHELRNPLAGVSNAAQLLALETDAVAVERARAIIERQAGNMVRLIDDLLEVSRVRHGHIELRREPIDLVGLVRDCVAATEHNRQERQQLLALAIPAGPLWIEGDRMRIDQVVTNLLDNANKFTRNGGRVWLTLEADAGRKGSGPAAVLRVKDNGAGIEPAMLERIFEAFVRGGNAPDRARGGVGLGLAVARRLVELHGGTIRAYSDGGAGGSEFVVRLPLLDRESMPAAAPARHAIRPGATPRRILVVDDNLDSAESTRMLLHIAGHEVSVALTGAEAIARGRSERPEIVMLDIGLPDMEGYEVARALRATPGLERVLIVAVTGYGRDQDVRRARDAGIDHHMTKPIDLDVLLRILADAAR